MANEILKLRAEIARLAYSVRVARRSAKRRLIDVNLIAEGRAKAVERLSIAERERDEAKASADNHLKAWTVKNDLLQEANSRLSEAVKALEKYGDHLPNCSFDVPVSWADVREPNECDCGLATTLTSLKGDGG